MAADPPLRIAIVAEHASIRFGGEAALPLHYFRFLRERGHAVWLVVHARTRDELSRLFPDDPRICYIEDTGFHRSLWKVSTWLPARVGLYTAGFAMRLSTQLAQRRRVAQLIRSEAVQVVHQPMPVSPREPSVLYGLGVPVVIGPMNGGMDYPPAFKTLQRPWIGRLIAAGRAASDAMNVLLPGKLRAAVLLVANDRTRRALPTGVRGRVVELVENGVDLSLWADAAQAEPPGLPATRFVFMGRLVDWKAVDLLIRAFAALAQRMPVSLCIAGDGAERPALEALCRQLDVLSDQRDAIGKVHFAGWQSQADCAALLRMSSALVLPSLMECGGAVVLEAMAAARPVIATDWGGPRDYLDADCGVLVAPMSRDAFVADLEQAMAGLAASHARRVAMGAAGRAKVLRLFDWKQKVDTVVGIYRLTLAEPLVR